MKNFMAISRALLVAFYLLISTKIGKISPKKIIKKGKEHPVANAANVPTNNCIFSFELANLNRAKIDTVSTVLGIISSANFSIKGCLIC